MGKKLGIALICVLLLLSLAGCSVASEKEVVKYAEEKYGKATLVKTEEPSDEEIVCYFKDKEYGFEYYVTSYMNDIIIDGSTFGSAENKGSNFDIQYYNYINDTIEADLSAIENKYNVDISISDGTYIYYFARIYYKTSDTSNVEVVSKEVSDLYTALDTRHYWKDLVVEVYDANDEYLGAYHYEQEAWMTPEDETELFYIEHIENLTSKAVYLRKEQHSFTETGVDINNVVTVLGNPEVTVDSTVTYYIFSVDGEEYYMCDFMVMDDIGGYVWYTNYEE